MSDKTPAIGVAELLKLFSPTGQAALSQWIADAKEQRGANWIAEIQTEFPLAAWIVEIVATKDAAAAFAELQTAYPNYPLRIVQKQIFSMHGFLLAEINKPRG